VTGGTGFLGRAIVERLLADGERVKALARSEDSAGALSELGAEPVRGDVLDPEALTTAMRGCGLVYHAAGANAFCVRDPSPMFEVNVQGSENVIRAAARAEVKRVVYTSSAAVLGERKGNGRIRAVPPSRPLSLRLRALEVRGRARGARSGGRDGGRGDLLEPRLRAGPRASDRIDPAAARLPERAAQAVVDSTLSLIDIADCTTGHLLAAANGKPGERYVLSGATLTVREGLELLGRLSGVERPVRALRPSLVMTLATVVEGVARVRRRPARICRELARTLTHGHAYDGSKAARELGLQYTPIEETLRRTIDWWVEQGLVPAPEARRGDHFVESRRLAF
jgi:dihydroflavonol-4-reductase